MKILHLLLLFLLPVYTIAQESFLHTMSYDEIKGSPNANINNVAWIAGHWRGEAMGGLIEESWTPPIAGSIMGSFKFIAQGEVNFYELQVISEENNTLILRLKHFHANMKGWETKDETVDFRLVKIGKNEVYFDDFTFEKEGDNEMNVYVVVGSEEKEEEVKFSYKRVLN